MLNIKTRISQYENNDLINYYLVNEKGEDIIEKEFVNIYINEIEGNEFLLTTEDPDSTEVLTSFNLYDFSPNIILYFKFWLEFDECYLNTKITPEKVSNLIFNLDAILINWKYQFNFSDYEDKFIKILQERNSKELGEFHFEWEHLEPSKIYFTYDFSKDSIEKNLENFKSLFLEVAKLTKKKLENQNSIKNIFIFPEEIKVSCEQYLLYFAQFLPDLGINATSNLKEEAGKVLFSVTPTDDIEALDKIREALAIYLKLPESPIVYNDNFAAMRLQQQIENLQHSQRMTARELQFTEKLLIAQSETIQGKNLTISQQHSFIEQQNKIIEKITSKSIMMDSLENKEELEEIYDGVKVGESKWLKELTGIGLNPAKAIKTAVKNTFGKDEKKSVLGLDQED